MALTPAFGGMALTPAFGHPSPNSGLIFTHKSEAIRRRRLATEIAITIAKSVVADSEPEDETVSASESAKADFANVAATSVARRPTVARRGYVLASPRL